MCSSEREGIVVGVSSSSLDDGRGVKLAVDRQKTEIGANE